MLQQMKLYLNQKHFVEGETNVEKPKSFRIDSPKDCGNAPKKVLLKELTVALASNDYAGMSESMTDDIRWQIAGYKRFFGKEAIRPCFE